MGILISKSLRTLFTALFIGMFVLATGTPSNVSEWAIAGIACMCAGAAVTLMDRPA